MNFESKAEQKVEEQLKDKVKVACVNFMPVLEDKDSNLSKMEDIISEMNEDGVDLIVFPEMALTGYEVDVLPLAEIIPGPSTQRLAKLIKRMNLNVIFGMPELHKTEQTIVYNTAVLLGRSGVLGTYRKMHPFGPELEWATPGKDFPVWETNFGPIGIGICFDNYVFPEVPRTYAVKGCRLFINISAAGHFEGISDVPEAVMNQLKARVIENMFFLASANIVGVENPTEFFGRSVIIGPKPASVFCQTYAGPASDKKEEVIVAELDLSLANQFGYMDQRHPSCYGCLASSISK